MSYSNIAGLKTYIDRKDLDGILALVLNFYLYKETLKLYATFVTVEP